MRDRVPPRVSLDAPAADMDLLSEWLSQKAGRKVTVYVPQKGEQAQLVEMCRNNAAEQLAQSVGRTGREASALDELARLLGMAHPPAYIEAYDISNLAGGDNVAGMVVFENGRPLKSAYRKFKIKTVVGQDDYGSMREVIGRRLQEYFDQKDSGEGFGRLPDLILLDGGRAMCLRSGLFWKPPGWILPCLVWSKMISTAREPSRKTGEKLQSIPIARRLPWYPLFRRRSTVLQLGIIARHERKIP